MFVYERLYESRSPRKEERSKRRGRLRPARRRTREREREREATRELREKKKATHRRATKKKARAGKYMGPGKGEICVLIRKRRSGAESREKRGEGDDEGEGPEKPPTRELDDATIYESTIRATTRSREKPPYYYESAFFKP